MWLTSNDERTVISSLLRQHRLVIYWREINAVSVSFLTKSKISFHRVDCSVIAVGRVFNVDTAVVDGSCERLSHCSDALTDLCFPPLIAVEGWRENVENECDHRRDEDEQIECEKKMTQRVLFEILTDQREGHNEERQRKEREEWGNQGDGWSSDELFVFGENFTNNMVTTMLCLTIGHIG